MGSDRSAAGLPSETPDEPTHAFVGRIGLRSKLEDPFANLRRLGCGLAQTLGVEIQHVNRDRIVRGGQLSREHKPASRTRNASAVAFEQMARWPGALSA